MTEWPLGYTDTPLLPGTPWHVHDPSRPQPTVVTPAQPQHSAATATAPSDAVVLLGYNSSPADHWTHLDHSALRWRRDGDELEVVPKSGDIRSVAEFGSVQVHVEWQAPREISATSQGRGNSGVFLHGLYEIQVLDGFANPTYADGSTAAIYGQYPPLVNACVAPGAWHSYDIVFEAPVFEDEQLVQPAWVTVFHNGILVHLRQRLDGPTQHRQLANYDKPHAARGPLVLQDHRDRVRFRNIWVRDLELPTVGLPHRQQLQSGN